ncbi:MAG TPA: discoidin domain-containing protein [Candidatus Acidoferrum sp.]|nr:discoidin domain-containing protein [Candidatus Acidoferrum sp.]
MIRLVAARLCALVYRTMTNVMKVTFNVRGFPRALLLLAGAGTILLLPQASRAAEPAKDAPAASAQGLVPLDIKLPAPAFKGTPKDIQVGPNVEPVSDKPRPLMMVPPGLKNIATGSKITCSDKNATAENLAKLTDGDKEASDQSIIFIHKGLQWVQLDFGSPQQIYAVVIWHAHNSAKVYHDVVVQVADDPDFIENVRTIFNNDADNASGLGVGTDREYFETYEGKLINAKGVKARYIRFYSKGSTESALNEYTELEVYGRPAK